MSIKVLFSIVTNFTVFNCHEETQISLLWTNSACILGCRLLLRLQNAYNLLFFTAFLKCPSSQS